MITIDSRRCGGRKTTDPVNGIYSRIRKFIQLNERVLVVVPSIKLQHQYADDLSEIRCHLINSENTTQSTTNRILDAFRNPTHSVVIITHAAFLQLPYVGYRSNWNLVIDEAIDEVIRIDSIAATDRGIWNPNFDLATIFDWTSELERKYYTANVRDNTRWGSMSMIRKPQASMLDSSESWRKLTNENYITWMTNLSWTTLTDQSGGVVKIIQTLNPDILSGWMTVHIAAAAFDYTAMSMWMRANNINYRITNKFVPQTITGAIHAPTAVGWRVSKNKLINNPDILKQFQDYVKQNAKTPVIAVRNSFSQNHSEYREVKERVKHNAYGINNQEWMTSHDISLESALIPDSLLISYISEHWIPNLDKHEANKAITHIYSAYKFHQLIYRSHIRTTDTPDEINIYVLDDVVAAALLDYFEFTKQSRVAVEIPFDIEFKTKPLGRPIKLTEQEREEKKRELNKRRYVK
jgi:hypothetical protein